MIVYVRILSQYETGGKHLIRSTLSRFVIHRHQAGRSHFDLRMIQEDILRSWSMLKEPPQRPGERRLVIERESLPPEAIAGRMFEEEAFGKGTVAVWDEGTVAIEEPSPTVLLLRFDGIKVKGAYRLARMIWYPGNRWILTRMSPPGSDARASDPMKR